MGRRGGHRALAAARLALPALQLRRLGLHHLLE
jgi:hypothetical protein